MEEYLYHYTNLDTLALILKNHTFRLSPLFYMDDKQESMTQEKINLGKYVFVSCWTKTQIESIPMWSMYTSKDSGVRIKLKSGFFKEYIIDKEQIKALYSDIEVTGDESKLRIIFPVDKFMKQPFYCTPFKADQLLVPVTYTPDPSLLQPKIIEQSKGRFEIEFGKLGRFKNMAWQFQKEWRYRMTVMPFSVEEGFTNPEQISNSIIQRIVSERYVMPTYIDLDIDDMAFNKLEITISPFMSMGNRSIVYDLIEKYCPSATIKVSELDRLV